MVGPSDTLLRLAASRAVRLLFTSCAHGDRRPFGAAWIGFTVLRFDQDARSAMI